MIELAARFWKLPIPATIFKLHDLGFTLEPEELTEDAIGGYQQYRVAYREKMLKLWKKYKGNLLRHPGTVKMLNRWHIKVERFTASNDLYPDLVGSADAREFGEAFIWTPHEKKRSLSVFKGSEWERVLILPFYDRPGRLSGFYFIGRDANLSQGDRFFRHIHHNYGNTRPVLMADAGLYFHPSIQTNRRGIIATSDPFRAMRMHLKQMNSGQPNLLNLVAWQHEGLVSTRYAWEMFRGRKIIFWAPVLDHKTFAQAIRNGGSMSVYGPTDKSDEGMRQFIRAYPPDEIVLAIENTAKPWHDVFSDYISTLDDQAAEALLLNLRLCDIDIVNSVSDCAEHIQHRVKSLLSRDGGFVSTQWSRGVLIEERNDCWYALTPSKANEYMLSNTVLQVDAIIASGTEARYVGKIRHRGISVDFNEDKKVVDQQGYRWLEAKMIEHRMGVLRIDPQICKKLAQTARLFNEPKLYQGYHRAGWDCDTRVLVTPGFGIMLGGNLKDVTLFGKNNDAPSPLPRPSKPLLPFDLVPLLTDDMDHALIWSVWCGLVANILAPAFNREPRGLAVAGGKAAIAGKIAGLALGCQCVDSKRYAETYISLEGKHSWPITSSMDGDAIKSRLARIIEAKTEDRNILLRVSPLTADVVLLNGGWLVASALEAPNLKLELWEKLARVFPAYMRSLMKRQFANFRQHADLVDDVASDVSYWLESEYGLATSLLIKAVKKLQLPRPGKLGSVMFQLLAKLVEQDRMVVIKETDWTRSPKIVRTNTHLVVSPEDVNRALISANVPSLNKEAAMAHLKGVGTQEIEQEGLPLWNIPVAQWDLYAKPASNLKIFNGA